MDTQAPNGWTLIEAGTDQQQYTYRATILDGSAQYTIEHTFQWHHPKPGSSMQWAQGKANDYARRIGGHVLKVELV